MDANERFNDPIGRWLQETAPDRLPQRVLDATFDRTRRTRQDPVWRAVLGRLHMPRFVPALGGAAVVVMATVLAFNFGLIAGSGGTPNPVASPTASALPSHHRLSLCSDSFRPETGGTLLGCTRDGRRLLIQKGDESLLVLHVDGSETEVADISRFNDLGSARPSGATISPDGSRVVFAGLTRTSEEGHTSCHDGALFAVDADGGSAEVLWRSQAASEGGIVRYPTFSPDGTQIAFADGYCDSDHSVWVMNADGSDAHQIVSSDMGLLGATHVRGLAWSPDGDRIALQVAQGTYTFATDGSAFQDGGGSGYCWPGRQCSAGLP